LGRYNYGYAVVIHRLWKIFNLEQLSRRINNRRRIQLDWITTLQIMIAERINEPCSKLQNSFNQQEYIGFSDEKIALHHFYRTLDVLSSEEKIIKEHLFKQSRTLFSTVLDVVFYDVTTLYFESHVEKEDALRQKGYSKDGKAHKTQVVLGLLVDKARNPISYQIYQGNTYEGGTMIDALKKMKSQFTIDRVVVVADSAMIDKANRSFMVDNQIDYIIGDSIKTLGKKVQSQLIDINYHIAIANSGKETFSYRELNYKGRRIICTYSSKRARKDAHERQKLIDKADKWLAEPSKYKQVQKRGAGRFITTDEEGTPIALDQNRIKQDKRFDGFKALATTTDLAVEDILSKYRDLFEVEHTFRALKSHLEIRPIFHWTDERIKGHICMCFIAFTFINHLRIVTGLQYQTLIKGLDKMQLSHIQDNKANNHIYLRSKIDDVQETIINALKLKVPNDTTPQSTVNQYFMK
jgi:transposase